MSEDAQMRRVTMTATSKASWMLGVACACAGCMGLLGKGRAPAPLLDRVTFGDAASETAHQLACENCQQTQGGLDERCRRIGPNGSCNGGYCGKYGAGCVEMICWLAEITGDPAVKGRAADAVGAYARFLCPGHDAQGRRALRREGIISWRNNHTPGRVGYGGNLYAALELADPTAIREAPALGAGSGHPERSAACGTKPRDLAGATAAAVARASAGLVAGACCGKPIGAAGGPTRSLDFARRAASSARDGNAVAGASGMPCSRRATVVGKGSRG